MTQLESISLRFHDYRGLDDWFDTDQTGLLLGCLPEGCGAIDLGTAGLDGWVRGGRVRHVGEPVRKTTPCVKRLRVRTGGWWRRIFRKGRQRAAGDREQGLQDDEFGCVCDS